MASLKGRYTGLNLSPTLELLDPLNPVRRQMALWLLPLGSLLAGAAYWASRPGGLDPVDRIFLPPMALGFLAFAALLWRFPTSARWVIPGAHALIALYLLSTLTYQLLFKPNPLGLSPAAYWVPFFYFSSYLFFPAKRAARLALLYLLTLFPVALLGLMRNPFQPVHWNALTQFFGANLAYVGLLYLLVRLKEGYMEAQLDAYTDFLTGLRNRRYLELILERELFRLQRYGRPLSLVLLDLGTRWGTGCSRPSPNASRPTSGEATAPCAWAERSSPFSSRKPPSPRPCAWRSACGGRWRPWRCPPWRGSRRASAWPRRAPPTPPSPSSAGRTRPCTGPSARGKTGWRRPPNKCPTAAFAAVRAPKGSS